MRRRLSQQQKRTEKQSERAVALLVKQNFGFQSLFAAVLLLPSTRGFGDSPTTPSATSPSKVLFVADQHPNKR